jgi:hypothetical protein
MTVAHLEDTMPNAEFMAWSAWHARQAQARERAANRAAR